MPVDNTHIERVCQLREVRVPPVPAGHTSRVGDKHGCVHANRVHEDVPVVVVSL